MENFLLLILFYLYFFLKKEYAVYIATFSQTTLKIIKERLDNIVRKPNILFLLSEDICPHLGCYNDPDAITPNLDILAGEGMIFENANSVAPVCSAARTTLALGVYPCSAGVGNHRSSVTLPEHINVISKYMGELGYHSAINKTDYNFAHESSNSYVEGWDTFLDAPFFIDDICIPNCMRDTWRKTDGKPFFFMNTFAVTHQSKYGFPNKAPEHRKKYIPRTREEDYRDRAQLNIPSYHPDNNDTREIWGQYHETITAMDRMVGETIAYLKEDGIYDDTIIIFVGDNGMGIPGGKANMWNEGVHVPMIVRIPDKYKYLAPNYIQGGTHKAETSFIDIPRTILRLAGGVAPEHMHGRDFLTDSDVKYSYSYRNRIDTIPEFVRIVRSNDFIYIRNFYPHRGWRFSPYMVKMAPHFVSSWQEDVAKQQSKDDYTRKTAFFLNSKPAEELYDLRNDKAQMHNLATNPIHRDTLNEMRSVCINFMLSINDMGFIPEQLLNETAEKEGVTHFEMAQNKDFYPLDEIIALTNLVFEDTAPVEQIKTYLNHSNKTLQFWAIQLVKYFELNTLLQEVEALLDDPSVTIKVASAETIISMSDCETQIAKAKKEMALVLAIEDDALAVLDAGRSLYRLSEKAVDLIPLTQRLCDSKKVTTQKGQERVVQAVLDVATYTAEVAGIPFDYGTNDNINQRLVVLRDIQNGKWKV